MKVYLIDHTFDPENVIGLASAICYDAKTDRDSNVRRAAHCKNKGHLSTLRFSYASVSIEGISRVCSHQLVRIAHAGILQESQRYVQLSNIEYVTPDSVSLLNPRLQERWMKYLADGSDLYNDCIKDGQKKEDARYILPQSCTTKVNLCLNFQGWRDVIKNRTSKTAQWEIREVFEEIEKLLHDIAPGIF